MEEDENVAVTLHSLHLICTNNYFKYPSNQKKKKQNYLSLFSNTLSKNLADSSTYLFYPRNHIVQSIHDRSSSNFPNNNPSYWCEIVKSRERSRTGNKVARIERAITMHQLGQHLPKTMMTSNPFTSQRDKCVIRWTSRALGVPSS